MEHTNPSTVKPIRRAIGGPVCNKVRNTPENQPLGINSDSKLAIEELATCVQGREAKDWIGVTHGPLSKCAKAWLGARTTSAVLW